MIVADVEIQTQGIWSNMRIIEFWQMKVCLLLDMVSF